MPARTSWIPYALIAPSVVFLGALFLVPLVQTVWLSVSAGEGLSLENYRRMAGDLNFSLAVKQHVPAHPRGRAAPGRAGARYGHHGDEARQGPRSRPVGAHHSARHLGSRSRPRLARPAAEHRLSEFRALRARDHPRPGRMALAGDAGRPVLRHRARRGLARHGHRAGDPDRRPAADPEGIFRGRRDLRGEALDALHADHAAASEAQPAIGADPAHGARLRGLRRRLRARRAQLSRSSPARPISGRTTTRTTASPPPMRCSSWRSRSPRPPSTCAC